MPRRTPIALCAVALMLIAAIAATARAQGYTPIDAEAQIKKCRDLSQADRDSGATHRMRSGTLKTVLCLEEAIVAATKIMFEPRYVSEKLAREWLRDIRFSAGGFYWAIYNEHKGCEPSCGTMWHPIHLAENAAILQEMLRTMARQWDQYPPRVKR